MMEAVGQPKVDFILFLKTTRKVEIYVYDKQKNMVNNIRDKLPNRNSKILPMHIVCGHQ